MGARDLKMGGRIRSLRARLVSGVAALALTATAAWADGVMLTLPAQDLAQSLKQVARVTGTNILFTPDAVEGIKARALSGKLTAREAVVTLIAGANLQVISDDSGGLIVTRKITTYRRVEAAPVNAAADDVRVAQAAEPPPAKDEKDATESTKVEKVVVTGTRIKGVKDQFSPVTKITRDQMDRAGQGSVADVFDTLPQNSGAGVSPDSRLTQAGSAAGAGSASVNLRGLGNEATLILLNGRRLAPGGAFGDFVDISTIPTTAISRIEVVMDGASAIYGSDAIAGVVNIVTRDDFDGVETRLGISATADGGGTTARAGNTIGFSSDRAHGLLSYEYALENQLDANDRSYSSGLTDPFDLLPFSQKNSLFASGGAELSDSLRLSGDAYYNHRKTKGESSQPGARFVQQVDVDQVGGALGLEVLLSEDWEADVSTAYSRSEQLADRSFLHLPPGSGAVADSTTEIVSFDAMAQGPLFALTEEAVKGAFGVHFRSERADLLETLRPFPAVSMDISKSRDVFAAFGEIYAPLVSESDAVPAVHQLAFTAAARYEDFSDVGHTLDPRFAVVWSPVSGLNARGTWGTSFRVPRLDQLRDTVGAALLGVYLDPASPTGESVALAVSRETSDLDPEQAEAWTVGVDINPTMLQEFQLRATYFNILYDGRIGRPTVGFNSAFRMFGFTGVPTRNPSPAEVQAFVDSATFYTDIPALFPALFPVPVTLADVTVILDMVPQNTTVFNVDGIDLEANYSVPSEFGNWHFSLTASILNTFERQFSVTTPVENLLDTFGNPPDLKMRGSLSWSTKSASASIFCNYVDDYTNTRAPGGPVPLESWTTVDASIQLHLGELFGGTFAQDTSITLAATNLFDEAPPQIDIDPFNALAYDPANADPIGRRVSLQLTKNW